MSPLHPRDAEIAAIVRSPTQVRSDATVQAMVLEGMARAEMRLASDAVRAGRVPDALHHSREEARLRTKASGWRRVARTAFDSSEAA